MTIQSSPNPRTSTGIHWKLPSWLTFTGIAVAFTSLYLSAGALTPLLAFHQEQWQFSASILTLAFAIYAAGFLTALLTVGSLSDYIGRRPVLVGALLTQLVSILIFLMASDIGWVILARLVQGFATGTATSAFTAALTELAPTSRKTLGSIIGSSGMTGGLSVGALLSGFTIQFNEHPSTVIFTALLIFTLVGIITVTLAPESVMRSRGALRSLIPRLLIPAIARREFISAIPVIIAVWMFAGLLLGLAPTIIREVFDLNSGLLNGFSGFIAPAFASVSGVVFARFAARTGITIGIYISLGGTVLVIASVLCGSLGLMIVGQILGGLGFGAALSASLRLILPLVEARQRAATVAGIYVVAYLAFSVPVAIAGQLAAPLGLLPTLAGYGAVIFLLAVFGLIAQLRIRTSAGD